MAKNLVVTLSGYVQDIKQTKNGSDYAVIKVDKKKKEGDQWVVAEKHYFSIILEAGHNISKDDLYEVTGELDISKWNDDKGNEKVSFWVKKSQWKKLATVQKQDTIKNGWAAQAEEVLAEYGAVETPF